APGLFHDMERKTHHVSVFQDRMHNHLPDPPRRIRGKAEPFPVVEFRRSSNKSEVSLFDEVFQGKPLSNIFFGKTYHQSQVRFYKLVTCIDISPLCSFRQGGFVWGGEERDADELTEIQV